MKKKLIVITFTLALVVMSSLSAFATITSTSDITATVQKLYKISKFDAYQYVNKADLVGMKRDNFNMATEQYKGEVASIIGKLENINNQISQISRSSEMSENEKQNETEKLYSEADSYLYEVNSKTLDYLYSIKRGMPSISYQRYSVKFKNFYDGLQLTK